MVAALDGLGKHNQNLIIYIDVQPGEILWAFLLQELQSRALSIPVLISIRDEDYNLTPISGKSIQYGVVELALSKEEAAHIYDSFTETQPHAEHRTFEDAWQSFGGQGPLIEFVYLLTNNQTLAQRLQDQIDALLREGVSDEWLELLQLVCYNSDMDEKYNPLKHPNVALTALDGAPTYEHGKTDHVTATISIGAVTECELQEPETAVDDTMELLSNEEIEALFHLI